MFLYCKRCNRPLKTERSRDTGYGPVCAEKQKQEDDERFNRAQITIFEFVEERQVPSFIFLRSSIKQV